MRGGTSLALEVTILRVKHGGISEAKKLLPYIKSCDVWAPEYGMCSEEEAQKTESEWVKSLTESRTQVLRHLESLPVYGGALLKKYHTKQFDYLYISQKRIWHVERCTPEEEQILIQLYTSQHELGTISYKALLDRNFKDFFDFHLQALEHESQGRELRDKIMARNLSSAEARIKETYALEDKDPLRLIVPIGGLHRIEKYSPIPVCSIIELRGEPQTAEDALIKAREQGRSSEELKPYILAFGASLLPKERREGLTEQQMMRMSLEELMRVVQSPSQANR